ncbi:hypothetical protein EVAR_98002_1 [Eumeta japonica]|uniref:Uncharacterized protein n=1 Tax=Eumeta variegata TaxID=151549 RepID=A0A4C1WIE8_EUMVA|nr:hypothetical protein EVAR_98002_1 [Eumeta japonica]
MPPVQGLSRTSFKISSNMHLGGFIGRQLPALKLAYCCCPLHLPGGSLEVVLPPSSLFCANFDSVVPCSIARHSSCEASSEEAYEPPKCSWSSLHMNTRNFRGVTCALASS